MCAATDATAITCFRENLPRASVKTHSYTSNLSRFNINLWNNCNTSHLYGVLDSLSSHLTITKKSIEANDTGPTACRLGNGIFVLSFPFPLPSGFSEISS